MKHMALLLLSGLAVLPHAVQADQTPVSACVEALEQLKTAPLGRSGVQAYGRSGTSIFG
jgi:hypothetical protein